MEEKKNGKKNKIVKVTVLLGLFLLVFGVSYALFTVVLNGAKKNKITTGNIQLELLNESGNTLDNDTVGLESAVPITYDEAMENVTPYTFILKNTGTIDTEYSISLEDLELATGEERLEDKYVRIEVEKGVPNTDMIEDCGSYILENTTNRIIDAGVIKKGTSTIYKVYLWLDQNADNNAMNKTFLSKIKIKGNQITNQTISNTIITRSGASYNFGKSGDYDGLLTRYADGRIEIKGKNVEAGFRELSPHESIMVAQNLISFVKRAGYNIEEENLSNYYDFYDKYYGNDEKVMNLMIEEMQKIVKKYNLENEVTDPSTLPEYINEIKNTNPDLARKIDFDIYLAIGFDSLYGLGGTIAFDENIEKLSIDGGESYEVDEIVLPSNLKTLTQIWGFTSNKLTIPASVKFVDGNALNKLRGLKTIDVMGSTEGWGYGWLAAHSDAQVNYLG